MRRLAEGDQPYRVRRVLAGRRIRRHVPLGCRRRLAVIAAGMVGGTARMALSSTFGSGAGLPWGTLAANLSGSLLLGYLLTRLLHAAPRATLTIPLLCTGLLGSFTTFSTFSVETIELVEEGRAGLAAGYAGGSVVFRLVAAAAGIRLAERRARS